MTERDEITEFENFIFKYSYSNKLKFLVSLVFLILAILTFIDLYCGNLFLKNFSNRIEGSQIQHKLNHLLLQIVGSANDEKKNSQMITQEEIDLTIHRLLEELENEYKGNLITRMLFSHWRSKEFNENMQQLNFLARGYFQKDLKREEKIQMLHLMIPQVMILIEELNIASSILLSIDMGTYSLGTFFGYFFPYLTTQIHKIDLSHLTDLKESPIQFNEALILFTIETSFENIISSFPQLNGIEYYDLKNLYENWVERLKSILQNDNSEILMSDRIRSFTTATKEFEQELFEFYDSILKGQFVTYFSLVLLSLLFIVLTMLATLRAYRKSVNNKSINEIKTKFEELINQDRNSKVKIIEGTAIGDIAKYYNQFATLIDSSFKTANKGAQKVLDMSHEFEKTILLLHETIESQTDRSDKIVTLSERLNQASSDITLTIENANHALNENMLSVKQGDRNISNLEKNIFKTKVYTENLLNSLNFFQDMIGNINKIINLIIIVVDQANLLSVNSSINASKMGKVGASFSIISDKIKELADQSAYFTLDIENLINTINFELINISSIAKTFGKEISEQLEDMQVMKNLIQQYISILYNHFETLTQTKNEIMLKKETIDHISSLAWHYKDLSNQIEKKSKDLENYIINIESLSQEILKCFSTIK